MRNRAVFFSGCAVVLVAIATGAQRANAYMSYDDGGNGCVQCHPGFVDGFSGPLHQQHVGSSATTNNCLLCHTEVGDDPMTDESGDADGMGCIGCHEPFGLRLHHENAGAPADENGLFCRNCHPSDGVPPGENVVNAEARPYYLRSDVTVKDPCQAEPAPPGEDFNADTFGLDNDGDLAYDNADTDCGPVACIGDCEESAFVTVDELVTGVNIALGVAALDLCPAFDADDSQTVTVNELITGVNNALTGCP